MTMDSPTAARRTTTLATRREPPPPVAFPAALESWRTAPGLDHAFLTRRVLAEINFCLFCGAPAESWEFRCADCRRRCLDPDCHRSAASRPERPCEDCEACPGRLSCPPSSAHGTSLCPPSAVELYCPCCLRGCRCGGLFQAHGNIGEGGLADLTRKDLRRSREGTNVVGDGLSCFVYRYRLQGGGSEFGMTYSPVTRIDRRRRDQTVKIDTGFLNRLPGLDWLSARLPCRHWAYLLECAESVSPCRAVGGQRKPSNGPRNCRTRLPRGTAYSISSCPARRHSGGPTRRRQTGPGRASSTRCPWSRAMRDLPKSGRSCTDKEARPRAKAATPTAVGRIVFDSASSAAQPRMNSPSASSAEIGMLGFRPRVEPTRLSTKR